MSWDSQGGINFLAVHILLDNEQECVSSNASGYFCLQKKSSCVTGPASFLAVSYNISHNSMDFSNQPWAKYVQSLEYCIYLRRHKSQASVGMQRPRGT